MAPPFLGAMCGLGAGCATSLFASNICLALQGYARDCLIFQLVTNEKLVNLNLKDFFFMITKKGKRIMAILIHSKNQKKSISSWDFIVQGRSRFEGYWCSENLVPVQQCKIKRGEKFRLLKRKKLHSNHSANVRAPVYTQRLRTPVFLYNLI